MTKHSDIVNIIAETRLIAIIRLKSDAALVDVARAIAEGGIRAIEITMNTPGALDAITKLRAEFGKDVAVGAGTVRSMDQLELATEAGAQFIVSPDTNPEIILETKERDRVSIPGALTPTEVSAAHEAGADFIKLFPADQFGPAYVRALLAPLDDVRILPTGGVRPDNIPEYLQAGAAALAVGSSLVDQSAIDAGDWARITATAAEYVNTIRGCT